jgi:hypothetical protein
MGQFGIETRKWLESAIKQRKLLLKLNKSHKPHTDVEMAISQVDGLLKTYTFENDLYMARFIQQYLRSLEIIIPGKGSAAHVKRDRELTSINKRAIEILLENSSKILTHKNKQYEMDI